MRDHLADGMAAGAAAAVLSGVPSTVHALLSRADPLAAALAAGSIVLPHERRRVALLTAGAAVHGALSLGWALVLVRLLPQRQTVAAGCVAGAAIAALDLGVVGRRFPGIRRLPTVPQVADHVAYGAIVATVVQQQRRRA